MTISKHGPTEPKDLNVRTVRPTKEPIEEPTKDNEEDSDGDQVDELPCAQCHDIIINRVRTVTVEVPVRPPLLQSVEKTQAVESTVMETVVTNQLDISGTKCVPRRGQQRSVKEERKRKKMRKRGRRNEDSVRKRQKSKTKDGSKKKIEDLRRRRRKEKRKRRWQNREEDARLKAQFKTWRSKCPPGLHDSARFFANHCEERPARSPTTQMRTSLDASRPSSSEDSRLPANLNKI